jgi:hypothetical protein
MDKGMSRVVRIRWHSGKEAIFRPTLAMQDLPLCRWRDEELSPGRYACRSPKLIVGPVGVEASLCSVCYCRDHEPVAAVSVVASRAPLPCVHLGGDSGERRQCRTCSGHVEIKLRACAKYGACTPHGFLDDVACCQGCPDYDAGTAACVQFQQNR